MTLLHIINTGTQNREGQRSEQSTDLTLIQVINTGTQDVKAHRLDIITSNTQVAHRQKPEVSQLDLTLLQAIAQAMI